MRRADRLFQLVQVLRVRRFATGDDLARELGVSTRTVYRDVRDLVTSGVPIQGEAGVGYRLERGFELPPLTFNTSELEGLALGARIVTAWGDPELAAAVHAAMTKIEAALPQALRHSLFDTALFAPGYPAAAAMARGVGLLRRAIGERRRIRFAYTREDGAQSERDARPLGLFFWGNRWTLAAWCELRQDYRSFRPDRMEELRLLPDGFEPDESVSLASFLARAEEERPRHEAPPSSGSGEAQLGVRGPGDDPRRPRAGSS
jgi:predicted DNA-binding transcriptional regulator YafY